jgi:hypothetical protein
MRIAISGTYFLGKTTLGQDFVTAHPEYNFQQEPYHQLTEEDTRFKVELSLESFVEQLEYSLVLFQSTPNENVVFDLCPVDLAGYILAWESLDEVPIADSILHDYLDDIRETIDTLDVIAFLPLDQHSPKYLPEDEDPEFRALVDQSLKELYRSDILGLFPDFEHTHIIELSGARKQRVETLTLNVMGFDI